MKRHLAANASIVLAVIGGPLCYYGFWSGLGDPAPWVSATDVEQRRTISAVCLLVGVAASLAAVWLAGRGSVSAPRRSFAGLVVALAPFASILWAMVAS